MRENARFFWRETPKTSLNELKLPPIRLSGHSANKYMHKYNEAQRKAAKKATKQKRVGRRLVCNLNLCAACDNEFHGVDLSSYKGCAD
jgi:hypothetical protein